MDPLGVTKETDEEICRCLRSTNRLHCASASERNEDVNNERIIALRASQTIFKDLFIVVFGFGVQFYDEIPNWKWKKIKSRREGDEEEEKKRRALPEVEAFKLNQKRPKFIVGIESSFVRANWTAKIHQWKTKKTRKLKLFSWQRWITTQI